MRKNSAVIAVVLSLGTAALARAGEWTATFGQGMAYPIGRSAKSLEEAYHFQIRADYESSAWLSYGLETGLSAGHRLAGRFNVLDLDRPSDGGVDDVGYNSDASIWIVHVTPTLKVSHRDRGGNERLYAIVGAGFFRVVRAGGDVYLTGATTAGADASGTVLHASPSSRNALGVTVGVGGGFQLWESIELGLDLRLRHLIGPQKGGLGDDAGLAIIPTASLNFLLF